MDEDFFRDELQHFSVDPYGFINEMARQDVLTREESLLAKQRIAANGCLTLFDTWKVVCAIDKQKAIDIVLAFIYGVLYGEIYVDSDPLRDAVRRKIDATKQMIPANVNSENFFKLKFDDPKSKLESDLVQETMQIAKREFKPGMCNVETKNRVRELFAQRSKASNSKLVALAKRVSDEVQFRLKIQEEIRPLLQRILNEFVLSCDSSNVSDALVNSALQQVRADLNKTTESSTDYSDVSVNDTIYRLSDLFLVALTKGVLS